MNGLPVDVRAQQPAADSPPGGAELAGSNPYGYGVLARDEAAFGGHEAFFVGQLGGVWIVITERGADLRVAAVGAVGDVVANDRGGREELDRGVGHGRCLRFGPAIE